MKSTPKVALISIFLALAMMLNACTPQATPSTPTSSVSTAIETATNTNTPVVTATDAPATFSAILSEITGKVEVKQSGQDAFSPAQANSALNENGQALTGSDGHLRLDLSTGTIVRVAPDSLFTLTSNEPVDGGLKTRIDLALGELYVILNGGSLEVETPTGTAAVRGSYMSVGYDSNSGGIKVTCLEGHCSLKSAGGSVEITAGQTAVITGIGEPPQVGEMSDEDIQEWLDNNPEAQLVVSALEDIQTDPLVLPPPLIYVPPAIKTSPRQPTATPTRVPTTVPTTPPPSLVPTVEFTTSPSVSSMVGEMISFSIAVMPSAGGLTPTGEARVLANGNSICTAILSSDGAAYGSCNGSIPAVGNPTLVVEYLGDVNYVSAQSAAQSYVVMKASTFINPTPPPNSSVVNEPAAFTATVDVSAPGSGLPTGSVTFSDGTDECTVNSAPWTCNITFTTAGTKYVTATYSGDANFSGSSSNSVPHTVNQASTTIAITGYTSTSAQYTTNTVTATVNFNLPSAVIPTGSVTFSDGTDSCTAYSAPWTCDIAFISLGIRSVTATYSGDANFSGSTSSPVSINVTIY